MGRAWKLHDNVNTDEIIPGRYNMTTDRASLAKHCLCEVRPDFPTGVQPGDVIVGGRNFGCGSSREHAPIAIQSCGVSAVVAPSFARIFYRNAVNIGLPLLVCKDSASIKEGDEVEPLPTFIGRIAEAGGILEFIKRYGWEGVDA
jgi:3-isopropylmalate/(R)-2-methylmalate dehydratase small subunit